MKSSDKTPENIENALQGIRDAYTLASTPAQNSGEADQLAIKNFLGILAEVAVNIAARSNKDEQLSNQDPDL